MRPLFKTLSQWWSAFIGDLGPADPAPVEPTPAPPPAPVLSCLVQGLIKSIQTETAQWETAWTGRREWRHLRTRFAICEGYSWSLPRIAFYPLYLDPTSGAPSIETTKDETTALRAAIETFITAPALAEARREAEVYRQEEILKAKPIVAQFEALGCPPPTPEVVPVMDTPELVTPRRRRSRSRRTKS